MDEVASNATVYAFRYKMWFVFVNIHATNAIVAVRLSGCAISLNCATAVFCVRGKLSQSSFMR